MASDPRRELTPGRALYEANRVAARLNPSRKKIIWRRELREGSVVRARLETTQQRCRRGPFECSALASREEEVLDRRMALDALERR